MKEKHKQPNSFKEEIIHGTTKFPLEIYPNIDNCDHDLILYNHWHEEMEIIYIQEGLMELVINGTSIMAEKNMLILVAPNSVHGAYRHNNKRCEFTSIVFHPNFIESKTQDKIQTEYLEPIINNQFNYYHILQADEANNAFVRHLLDKFIQLNMSQQNYKELLLKGYLYQIMFHLLLEEKNMIKKTAIDYLVEERKKNILTFIELNYQNPLTLNDLANSLSLSKEQFCRFFKQSFRTTPIKYLNQYRINQATNLLRETTLSIIEIAFETGFENSNYFAISFKKTTGQSPSQFRKMTLY